MATTLNADGTVTQFKIGDEEHKEIGLVADKNGVPIDFTQKLNKDGSVKKKRGPAKKFDFDRKTISAMVAVPDYTDLVNAFGTPSEAIQALIKLWREAKVNYNTKG
jgi:hypothetical protein